MPAISCNSKKLLSILRLFEDSTISLTKGIVIKGSSFSVTLYIQLRKMNVIPLVNKPCVNEVTLTEHNLYRKSLKLTLCMLRRLRFFQRGTVCICRSTGIKGTSCQSWWFEKNSATWPTSNHASAAWVRFRYDRIILQLKGFLIQIMLCQSDLIYIGLML